MTRPARPFEPEDLLEFSMVADLQLAPDGGTVAFALKTVDRAGDDYWSQIWLVPATGGEAPRAFTAAGQNDRNPRWSPDGRRLAFVSSRGGAPQIYTIDRDGGEASQVTRLPEGAQKPEWSPDGATLLFAASVSVEQKPEGVDAQQWESRPRVTTRGFYKSDGVGFTLDMRTHLFTVPAGGGEATQLTRGDADDGAPVWSPDGRAIAFVRNRTGPRDAHRSDLWRMDADGSNARRLTTDLGKTLSPAWSPDGRTIAVYGAKDDGDARTSVWLVDAGTGALRQLVEPDFEVASYPLDNQSPPFWIEDGRALLVLQAHASTSRPVRIAVDDGRVTPLVRGERQVTMVSTGLRAGRVAFACSDVLRLCEISSVALDGGDERKLATPNAAFAAGRVALEMQRRNFPAPNGEHETRGWLVLPRERGERPLPLWVDLHGGPHAYVELGFPYHPYWHVLASRGWAVLAVDAIGSASYGKGFADSLRGHWGERDLPQHLAAVDGLVAEGLVDPARVAVGGKSYGGYLAAWAIGQTRRFCAAVISAPVSNLVSHFGTSDSGYYVTPFAMNGEPWEARENYARLSPVEYLQEATTPTLILQGEDDQRCPIGQAEEVFAALVRAGRAEVEFVRYPGGDHHLAEQGRPSHRVDYTRRIVAWAQRWADAAARKQG